MKKTFYHKQIQSEVLSCLYTPGQAHSQSNWTSNDPKRISHSLIISITFSKANMQVSEARWSLVILRSSITNKNIIYRNKGNYKNYTVFFIKYAKFISGIQKIAVSTAWRITNYEIQLGTANSSWNITLELKLPPLNSERLVIPVVLGAKNVDIRINSSLRHHRERDLAEINFLDLIDGTIEIDYGGEVKVTGWAGGAQDRMVRNRRTQGDECAQEKETVGK